MCYPLTMQSLKALLCCACFVAVPVSAQIPTFANADLVLGQPDFTTNTLRSTSASSLEEPRDVVVDPATGKVFVVDRRRDRILRFASNDALANNADAEAVFGRMDLDGNPLPGGRERSLNSPSSVALDSAGRLWVADTSHNRVLMFENAANRVVVPGVAFLPDLVLGQANLTDDSSQLTRTGMRSPSGVTVDDFGNLFVSDSSHNRILAFTDAANKTNGAPADAVYGQPDYMTDDSGRSATALNGPRGLDRDANGTLWVADIFNSRVLGFETASGALPNTVATRLLGQTSFTVRVQTTSASGMSLCSDVYTDDLGALWVKDDQNNRVLRFNSVASKPNGGDADAVIGQSDFDSDDFGLAANRLSSDRPLGGLSDGGLHVEANGDLWVADAGNNRVLRFSRPRDPVVVADVTRPTIRVRGRKTIETLRKRVVIRGTAADASGIARIEVKVRGAKVVKSKVKGNDSFKVVLRVRKDRGRVVAKLRAVDGVGLKSKRERFRILRR